MTPWDPLGNAQYLRTNAQYLRIHPLGPLARGSQGVDSKVMSIQPMLITLGPMPNLEQQRDLSPRARARARPRARMLFGGSKVMSIGSP